MYAVNGLLDCLAPFIVPIGNAACGFLTCWTSFFCGVVGLKHFGKCFQCCKEQSQGDDCSACKHSHFYQNHAGTHGSILAIWPIRNTKQWFCISYRTYDQDTIIFVEMQLAYWWKWSNLVEWHYSHFVIGVRTSILKVTYRGKIELNMLLPAFPFYFFFSELYRRLRVMNSETLWLITFLCCFTQKEWKSCIHMQE